MSFIRQVAKSFGGVAEFKFQAVMFGRDAFYIEGARPLKIGEEEMLFRAGGAVVRLCGSGLTVKEISGDCVSIIGTVTAFEVRDL